MKPTIRRAKEQDAFWFASRLRPEDAGELLRAHPDGNLWSILVNAITVSEESYTLRFGNEDPCILFGVRPIGPSGVIWMVGTPDIHGHAISILREARHWFTAWKQRYSYLCNYVEARNDLHVRWLQLLGAAFPRCDLRNGEEVLVFII